MKPRTTLIAHSNVKDYLSCSGMTPTVVENNLQRAIEKENEIDPEDQDGDVVITRVQSKLRKFSQRPRTDLNKRSLPRPKTITA